VPIRFETSAAVAVITIDRPEAMNALDRAHNEELATVMRRYQSDPALRAAVLTGAGDRAFCAGADLKDLLPSYRAAVQAGHSPVWAFGGITGVPGDTKPLIAAVNGYALAGGLEMALACDIRIASPNARFGLAETKLAITPGAGGTQRLPRTVPFGVAMEMILSGEPIGAEEALRWGLVNRLVDPGALVEAAVNLGHAIAARGPLAVRAARAAVLNSLSVGLEEGLDLERRTFEQMMLTEDSAEGYRAFNEKRAPQYRGR
jgi:enoyl-CoA hydratase/carnithine racemase